MGLVEEVTGDRPDLFDEVDCQCFVVDGDALEEASHHAGYVVVQYGLDRVVRELTGDAAVE